MYICVKPVPKNKEDQSLKNFNEMVEKIKATTKQQIVIIEPTDKLEDLPIPKLQKDEQIELVSHGQTLGIQNDKEAIHSIDKIADILSKILNTQKQKQPKVVIDACNSGVSFDGRPSYASRLADSILAKTGSKISVDGALSYVVMHPVSAQFIAISDKAFDRFDKYARKGDESFVKKLEAEKLSKSFITEVRQ